MKQFLLTRVFRASWLQPLWERLHGLSALSMNFWGGARIGSSGELWVLAHVVRPRLRSGVVFDVGANLGQYALAARRILGTRAQLYCFEPSRPTFERLTHALAAAPGIRTFNHGFSDRDHVLTLHHSRQAELSSLYGNNPLTTFDTTEEITLTTIDGFCRSHGITEIDFLKVDVEGHELSVLRGASELLAAGRIGCLQFEIGECNIVSRTFFRDFYEMLHGRYQLYRVLPRGLRAITKYDTLHEVFACVNYVAVRR
jgi:FkbM family methyltransferase